MANTFEVGRQYILEDKYWGIEPGRLVVTKIEGITVSCEIIDGLEQQDGVHVDWFHIGSPLACQLKEVIRSKDYPNINEEDFLNIIK